MLAGLPRRVAGRVAGKHYFKASTGVPEPPGTHDANFLEGQAGGDGDDDDDGSCFRARLADVGDEVEFARHLRTRCVHAYWLLLSAARVAETAGRLSSGVGRGALGAAWTVACVAFWLYVSLSRDAGRRIVDRAHVLVLVYISVNHALRLVYVYGLDGTAKREPFGEPDDGTFVEPVAQPQREPERESERVAQRKPVDQSHHVAVWMAEHKPVDLAQRKPERVAVAFAVDLAQRIAFRLTVHVALAGANGGGAV